MATQLLYNYGSYLKRINFHMLPLKLEIRHLPSANLINSSSRLLPGGLYKYQPATCMTKVS